MDGRAAAPTLGVILGLEGLAHLVKRRYFDSLVPDRFDPLRREIDIMSGSLQMVGATALFVPRLRQSSRWLNVTLQVATLLAAVDNLRHPDRIRRDRVRLAAAEPLVAGTRIPPRIAAIALVWWASRPTSATNHAFGRPRARPDTKRGNGVT